VTEKAWWWSTVAETFSLIQLSDNKDVLDWLNILYCYNTSGWITTRDLRSLDTHFNNRYKGTIPKDTMMPEINEASLDPSLHTKSTLQYTFRFCSDISPLIKIFLRNSHLSFLLSSSMSGLMSVFFYYRHWWQSLYLHILTFRYDIFVNCSWVVTRWQYTFTHKQCIEQHK
jgi:hypothetical protein